AGSMPPQHASADDAAAPAVQDTGFVLAHADNLVLPAGFAPVDFTIDTPSQPPSAPLTPLSLTDNFTAGDAFTFVDAGAHQSADFALPSVPVQDHSDSQLALPNSGPGNFALASLVPQMGGDLSFGNVFSQHGPSGGSTTPAPFSATSADGHFTLTLKFDSSVATAPTGFVADMDAVAQFFASNFTTPTKTTVTIDVGYGEVDGSHLSANALGESEAYYYSIGTGANGYSSINKAYLAVNSVESKDHSPVVSLPNGAADPVSGNQQWYVTSAEGKALGLVANNTSVDGYVGFASSSGLFFYDPANPTANGYDFMGTAAHEISEVLGRTTLDGEKYFTGRSPNYSPLDDFHFSSGATHDFSASATGYFSVDDGATALKYFNTNPEGDTGDWAVSTTPDSFDWAGGVDAQGGVSYADYLTMEAVGWAGTYSGGASNWTTFG
ncbi:MAG TPA: NF038122 family metalloprotease, partial [Urbifossiella sp.]